MPPFAPSAIKRQLLKRRTVLAAVALAALAVRVWTHLEFWKTPLDMYNRIETLDMKFLTAQAESFLHGEGLLTMHRLLCAVAAAFCGWKVSVEGVTLAQSVLGVLTGMLVCSTAMRLSGSRVAGLVAGLFAGCYAPALLYENFIMKESVTLFFSALALWSVCGRSGRKTSQLEHGLAAAGLLLARPAGLIWATASTLLMALRGARRKASLALFAPLAFAVVLGAALALNFALGGGPRLMDTNVEYNLQLGATDNPRDFNSIDKKLEGKTAGTLLSRALANAPAKALALLNAQQTPDNINYYFMKSVLPSLEWTPGPLLLLPFGLCGIAAGLFLAVKRRRPMTAILFAHFVCIGLPICLFVTAGRYALFLAPSLAAGAGLFAWLLVRFVRERRTIPAALLICLAAFAFRLATPDSPSLRADDFTAYGLASSMKQGPASPQAGACYARAFELAPESPGPAINLGKWLIDAGRPEMAVELLLPCQELHPESFGILANLSVALCMSGQAKEAEKLLLKAGEPADPARKEKWRALLNMCSDAQKRR